jgi:signal peptidase II
MVVGLGLDQLTKWWAETALGQGRVVSLIDDWLVLRLVRNPGAAFSLGESFTYVFTLLALIVLVAAWWWSARAVRRPVWAALIGVGLAGVTGNLIDRLCQPPGVGRGHVIDFISLRYFATFNVADICLTVAAAGLVIISFRGIGPR